MAYRKYDLNGRKMLNLDNLGMVDYDEYYLILSRSYERRRDITNKYSSIQNENMINNEPNINYTVLYNRFLEELKDINSEMYNQKLKFYEEYLRELSKEEDIFNKEKQQLLISGYLFDKKLKEYGYYIIKIDNDYFQYKLIEEKNVKIDMGNKLFPQNANISSYEFVAITNEDLQKIKMKIKNQEQSSSKRFR